MRALVPADSLVYLETNDLAGALQPIIDSKPFTEVAKSKPDFSALKGVQLAVAITGFETSEEKVSDEQSIGKIQPRFVAIADTHAFNFQAVGFAEQNLGSFVAKIYDSEPTLEKSEKNGGKYFTWTAPNNRKAYALVLDSLIYFGNDESAIEKCLAVRRGESDNITKPNKLQPTDPQTLAAGYVSPDGIAQIANILGLKFAAEAAEDSEVQSAIAGVVPQLIRNSITEIRWRSTKTNDGIEDKYMIGMPSDLASLFSETMTPAAPLNSAFFDLVVPGDLPSVTFYNLKNPKGAWKSLILAVQKGIDPSIGKIIGEFSSMFFEPYGVRDPEMFLSSIDSQFVVANHDMEGEKPFAMVWVKDEEMVQKAMAPDLKLGDGMTVEGIRSAQSETDDLEAAFDGNRLVIGSIEAVGNCFTGNGIWPSVSIEKERVGKIDGTMATAVTTGIYFSDATQIAGILSEKKSENVKAKSLYFNETSFTKAGIERRTVSDFGLIGSIIAHLNED